MEDSPLLALLRQRREVPQDMAQRYEANAPYVAPGEHSYNTPLPMMQEVAFRKWVQQNNVPFDAAAPLTDYDMRGFYSALQRGDPRAMSAVNPNDNKMHFPDFWKTPYHETFSSESQWAAPVAPQWNSLDQLVAPSGRIRFDERNR